MSKKTGACTGAVAAALMATLALAADAAAQPAAGPVLAEALLQQGLELRKQGKDQAALPCLQRAHALAPGPRAAGQLGLVERALGRWADAHLHLEEAAASPADPWVRLHRAQLEDAAAAARRHLGAVILDASPNGAEVSVDGRLVGRTPLPRALAVAPGQRRLELRAPGYRREERALMIAAGETMRLSLQLSTLMGTLEGSPNPPAMGSARQSLAAPDAMPAAAALAPPPLAAATTGPVGLGLTAPAAPEATARSRKHALLWAAGAAVVGGLAIAWVLASGSGGHDCGGQGRVCAR
jgi:hypothetical protein